MGRYFPWIKLRVDFLGTREMKRLLCRPNGWALFGIYVALLLLTANSDGYWKPDGLSESVAEELAMMVNCEVDLMQEVTDLLNKLGLLKTIDDGIIQFCQVSEMVGSETDGAERTRKCRERKRAAADTQAEFTPPSVEDIQAFCAKEGCNIDAQLFINHYTANGWMMGSSPMLDWRAAVQSWAARDAKPKVETKHTPKSTADRLAQME